MTVAETERWFTNDYLRIVSVHYDPHSTRLTFEFGDGDHAVVQPSQLVRRDPDALDWEHMTVEDHSFLHVPTLPKAKREAADIPGFDVRAITDAAFAAHLARSAGASARRVGERVRALRTSRGLTAKEVASRAGIAPLTMTRLEHGQHDVSFTLLQKVLAAMGYSLEDIRPEAPSGIPEHVGA